MHHSFFSGIEQQSAYVGDFPARTPTFYRDARGLSLIFPARLGALRAALPDPRLTPARLAPGIGAVHLSAFEYYDTDIEPYNELGVGVLLDSPEHRRLPAWNLARQLASGCFHTYVLRLPVTTELARRAGVELFNYPKFLASIDFEDTDERLVCRVGDDTGPILEVAGRKIPAERRGIAKYFCHTYQDRQPQSVEFKVNLRAWGQALGPGNGELSLAARHPLARELDGLLLSRTPLLYLYMPDIQAVLYGPEHLSLAMIGRFVERALRLGEPAAEAVLRAGASG